MEAALTSSVSLAQGAATVKGLTGTWSSPNDGVRVLEYFDDPSIQEVFLKEIIEDGHNMAKDQYAYYVVQHILQHGKALVRSAIIKRFIGKVMTMSKQKYASNVIEKCLVFGSYDEKQKIINEVLSSSDLITSGETDALMVMVNDQYANYVVQRVIETCDEWRRQLILECLRVRHRQLRHCTYAKHVVARLERLIEAGVITPQVHNPPHHPTMPIFRISPDARAVDVEEHRVAPPPQPSRIGVVPPVMRGTYPGGSGQ
ncbi:hypothetical protein E2562_019049 [Oryza meyeriana var. granulata]|uniref:PUM-HD domain-containing protein n=1 Tax=Oryza meyeriana var. granulata TaxID=110450 RepID=A0A6G1EMX5_9ORYZ|nr:hypothetical protein E2562_019049 [Oryza meyeriana var. granulata]